MVEGRDYSDEEIADILLDLPIVESAFVISGAAARHAGHAYSALAHCRVIVNDKSVPILMGLPNDWDTQLFDFYIEGYLDDFPYIPHIGEDGKLCLLNLDQVLIDSFTDGLRGPLTECVKRAVKLIGDGLAGANRADFIREFEAYWNRLPGCGKCIMDVPKLRVTSVIYAVQNPHGAQRGNRKARRKSRGSAEGSRVTKIEEDVAIAANPSAFSGGDWGWSGTIRKGAYIPVRLMKPVYPPDFRKPLSVDYVNSLLSIAPSSELRRIVGNHEAPFSIVFNLIEPDGMDATLAVQVKSGRLEAGDGVCVLTPDATVNPLSIKRVDRETLMGRTSRVIISGVYDDELRSNLCTGKNALVIGCGSIGGYLATLLAKAGCERMTIVDPDTFEAENIFRHVLGKAYVGQNKAKALQSYLKANIPGIDVEAYKARVERLVREGSLALSSFDMVFSATGNHTINLMVDRMLLDEDARASAFFVWNEPLDLGCHAAFIPGENYAHEGDGPTFFALFGRDSAGPYEISAYCGRGQEVSRAQSGCGSSYVPYGADVSLRASLITLDLVRESISGRLQEATIVSEKGEGRWFKAAGFKTSDVYDRQDEIRLHASISAMRNSEQAR